jgi:hypothetical protein
VLELATMCEGPTTQFQSSTPVHFSCPLKQLIRRDVNYVDVGNAIGNVGNAISMLDVSRKLNRNECRN